MLLSANWDGGFDMDTFPLQTGPHPLAYFMHWTAAAREKKNTDPSQCPRGKTACKAEWYLDVMFIKLCFNLNVGLGIEKYKVSFQSFVF